MSSIREILVCARAREWISAQIDGALSAAEGDALVVHLLRCSRCLDYSQRVRRTVRLLRSQRGEMVLDPVRTEV